MRFSATSTFASATAALLSLQFVSAQTYTKCNPLAGTCPADPALGTSKSIDFTSESSDFTGSGRGISYGSNGLSLTVAQSGDSPTITSNWYIMFGKVEYVIQAAPGVGIVSSAVLQSDDLDEIDWEWLGADASQVQSNYFGKGQTGTYNRGAFHPDPTSQSQFNTYTIEWTSDQVVWSINGQTVRILTAASAAGQFPQTPMQVKLGAWSGGDPSNAPGTIQWAGGNTNYAAGPYSMLVKSLSVSDYSTGTQYQYSDQTGNWQSITAVGGSVNSGGSTDTDTAPPAITSSSSGQPMPFSGTHMDSSSYITPSIYPWVSGPSTLATSVTYQTSIPGLPSGWTVTGSGKVVPPSSAPSTSPAPSSTSSSTPSPSAASSTLGVSELSSTVGGNGLAPVSSAATSASSSASATITKSPPYPTTFVPAIRPTGSTGTVSSGITTSNKTASASLAIPTNAAGRVSGAIGMLGTQLCVAAIGFAVFA